MSFIAIIESVDAIFNQGLAPGIEEIERLLDELASAHGERVVRQALICSAAVAHLRLKFAPVLSGEPA